MTSKKCQSFSLGGYFERISLVIHVMSWHDNSLIHEHLMNVSLDSLSLISTFQEDRYCLSSFLLFIASVTMWVARHDMDVKVTNSFQRWLFCFSLIHPPTDLMLRILYSLALNSISQPIRLILQLILLHQQTFKIFYVRALTNPGRITKKSSSGADLSPLIFNLLDCQTNSLFFHLFLIFTFHQKKLRNDSFSFIVHNFLLKFD